MLIGIWMRDVVVAVGKDFLKEQAALLLRIARTVSDPKASAAWIEKAAEITERRDRTVDPPDKSPHAPDVVFPPRGFPKR